MEPAYSFDGFIGIFDNYFEDAYINELINYYNKLDDLHLWQGAAKPKHLRDDEQLYMMDPNRIHSVHPHYINYFFHVIWEQVFPIYKSEFSILDEKKLVGDQLKMKKIKPGGGFHQWHYEALSSHADSKVVCQIYMNNVEEAGETEFLYQNKRISPKKNRLLLWPADWTYTHRGNPPIGKKDKYILTTWLREE